MTTKHPIGSMVSFYHAPSDKRLVGEVVDHITFNNKACHNVRVDGRVYDVWPNTLIEPATL